MTDGPACALCGQALDAEGGGGVSCRRCDQRVSLDSSRSTRGGSEVPLLNARSLNREGGLALSDGKGVIQAVGNRVKAVFGKGKENKGHGTETQTPAS